MAERDSSNKALAPLAWVALAVLAIAAVVAEVLPPGAQARDVATAFVLGVATVAAAVSAALAARASEGPARSAWWLACAGSVATASGALWIGTGGTGVAQFFDPVTATVTTIVATLLAASLVRLLPAAGSDMTLRAGWTVDGMLAAGVLWLVIWMAYGLVGPLAPVGAAARAYAALYSAQGLSLIIAGVVVWRTLRDERASGRWLAAAVAAMGVGLSLMVWWEFDARTGSLLAAVVVETVWIVAVGMIAVAGAHRLREPRASAAHLRDTPPGGAGIAAGAVVQAAVVVAVGLAAWVGLAAPWPQADRRLTMLAGLLLAAAAVARAVMAAADDEDVSARLLVDPLTGLFNGRYLRARLAEECRASVETGSPLAVAMVDIDDFAAANAACGRAVCDDVLRSIGERLGVEQGRDLIVARTGGDEFTLLMPGSDVAVASSRTAGIAAALASASGPSCRVTASAGVAGGLRAAELSRASGPDGLLERADRALYWAKYHGKDSVVVFDARTMGEKFDRSRPALADQRALAALVRSLAAANDAREKSRRDHSRNVARLAVRLGRALGMDEERLVTLENAALLHDIGLVCVPDAMLDRPRELDPQERDQLEEHPEVGARILAGTEMGYLAPLVAAHHERWDGTGYPAGLAGEAIPLESRIIAACDTYDGATSARPHHGARDRRAGIAALTEGMAGALDPTVAERLIMQLVIEEEPAW